MDLGKKWLVGDVALACRIARALLVSVYRRRFLGHRADGNDGGRLNALTG